MLIIGAKGFAKEVLEVLHQQNIDHSLVFYDDVNSHIGVLYDKYEILSSIEEAKKYFQTDNRFTIGLGNPKIRELLYNKFIDIGGKYTSTLSPFARVGAFNNVMGEGCNIMTNTVITNDVTLGKGVLINLSCTVGHDVVIGDFTELCPDVNVSGNCKIGRSTFIGTNAVLLPGIVIGNNVTIGAGTLVTKDVPDNAVVVGVPGKVIKIKS